MAGLPSGIAIQWLSCQESKLSQPARFIVWGDVGDFGLEEKLSAKHRMARVLFGFGSD
jgi:hypothetical protein